VRVVFSFVAVSHPLSAAPIAQDPTLGPIPLSQSTDFQKELATAAAAPDPRPALVAVSAKFIASPKFISSTSATAFQKQVNTLSTIFDTLEDAGIFDLKAVASAVKQVFDHVPSDVAKSADFIALVEALKDSITAIKFVQVLPYPLTPDHFPAHHLSRKNMFAQLQPSSISSVTWSSSRKQLTPLLRLLTPSLEVQTLMFQMHGTTPPVMPQRITSSIKMRCTNV